MKRIAIGIGLLLLALGFYIFYIMQSTGFFRDIQPSFDGVVVDSVFVPGAEDMEISHQDSFLIISSDDRAARRDGQPKQGHLYFMDLRKAEWPVKSLTEHFEFPFYPHGISMLQLSSSHYRIWAINHLEHQHQIEVFDLFGDSLAHHKSLTDISMLSPNDIVAIDEERFYFTNDHGYTGGMQRLAEDYMGLAVSNVVYFDGSDYQVVAEEIAYANGINADRDKQLVYLASPRAFEVKVYGRQSDGSLKYIEDIDCGTGVDNIEVAPDGHLWIGAHPNLLRYAAYAKGKKTTAPSEIITINYPSTGNYEVKTIYLDDGQQMSASSVAVPWGNYIFTGNVMDDHFIILKQ